MATPDHDSQILETMPELLQRVSAYLEPEVIEELTEGVKSLAHCEVPGFNFEPRLRQEIPAAGVVGGKYVLEYGKTTASDSVSTLVFSDLLEVDWTTQTEDGFVTIHASADTSGNHHPRLVITEHPKLAREAGGRICLIEEPQVEDWLGKFLYDLAAVDGKIYQFWNAPPERR